ncbi:DUF4340 domain-containing protein [Desulfobacula sp.]|uniref:DUF4340 domain-containing protein n=1 Tax=Desulfobacula sp. TaxID=2593537 RepID=UPI002605E66F|nr:DUF4340 domain-containing protein [Desulfobacula sp.]
MKKEYLILLALIVILSAYLFLHNTNKDHYTLPEIPKMDVAKITGFTLDKRDGSITFKKKGPHWTLTDKDYLADPPAVKNMLDTLKTLKLTALVSEKGDLKRYELDDENHIRVKVSEGAKTVFELTLGRIAPSLNHTFVMLTNDGNIYHANGSFRSYFNKTEDDFRDKKVMEFKTASIHRFSIEKDGVSKTLVSKEEKKDNQQTAITWHFEDGTSADQEKVSNLLSALSFLECETYVGALPKDELGKTPLLCRIRLENTDKPELTLFKTGDEDSVMGLSSMNDDTFVLSQFNSKEIVSDIDTILGIIKNEENKDQENKE